MASEMEELFGEIGAAKMNNKTPNLKDGQGVVLIKELLCKKLNEGPTFIAALKVVSSSSKGDIDQVTKQPVEPSAPGSAVSWIQKLKKFKSAPGNVKGFILTALNKAEASVSPDDFAKALARSISKEQPMRGMLLRYSTYQQQVQSGPTTGQWRTYVNFSHVGRDAGNSPEEIAARRAELDKEEPLVA